MNEELKQELQKRLRWLVNQVQSETNKYHQDCLIGRIENVERMIALIERSELMRQPEKQLMKELQTSIKPEINIDLLKNAIWYSEEYISLKDIDVEYLIEKYNDNKFIVDYLEMCARYNKIKKAAIELLMED